MSLPLGWSDITRIDIHIYIYRFEGPARPAGGLLLWELRQVVLAASKWEYQNLESCGKDDKILRNHG